VNLHGILIEVINRYVVENTCSPPLFFKVRNFIVVWMPLRFIQATLQNDG